MVRLAPVDLLDLLDLLERGESRDRLEPLASRVFPDRLELLERAESLETRVFLVRVELLVLLEPEVSVVSLERGAEPDLRVCRDLVDFLELLELMDPRELLDRLDLKEHKAPLVCRVCLEREVQVASQDLKETEETMVQRDLRELLERTVLEV
uniref:Uncharacterized protein n=1 Tax=Knipowitschia caucasica TaxID=637954 RepID=A0AAV2LZQ0_KNICA